jgi:hypothetical protein
MAYTVSGTVTGGATNVLVALAKWDDIISGNNAAARTTVTDASNAWAFLNVPNGEYILTGRVYGFTLSFDGAPWIEVTGANLAVVLVATPRPRQDVSGTITGAPNNSNGILVNIGPYHAYTENGGQYLINVATGTLTISPRLRNWTFDPASITTFVSSVAPSTGNNFTAIEGEAGPPKFGVSNP